MTLALILFGVGMLLLTAPHDASNRIVGRIATAISTAIVIMTIVIALALLLH
jgi:hypothetical protein